MRISDWSSDVCSSDLAAVEDAGQRIVAAGKFGAQFDVTTVGNVADDRGEADVTAGTEFTDADMDRKDLAVLLAAERVAAEAENLGAAGADRKSTRLNSSH